MHEWHPECPMGIYLFIEMKNKGDGSLLNSADRGKSQRDNGQMHKVVG